MSFEKTFRLLKRYPNDADLGLGFLSMDGHGDARFYSPHDGVTLIARMCRARVACIESKGLLITGFEEKPSQKMGPTEFHYCEWFLRYQTEDV